MGGCRKLHACGLRLRGAAGEAKPIAIGADLYTNSVCTALSIWKQHLESASAVLAQRTSTAKSLRNVRTQFVTFFGGAIDETDDMLGQSRMSAFRT